MISCDKWLQSKVFWVSEAEYLIGDILYTLLNTNFSCKINVHYFFPWKRCFLNYYLMTVTYTLNLLGEQLDSGRSAAAVAVTAWDLLHPFLNWSCHLHCPTCAVPGPNTVTNLVPQDHNWIWRCNDTICRRSWWGRKTVRLNAQLPGRWIHLPKLTL